MKSKIRSNVILSFINQGLTLIVPLITTPYVSRVFGAEKIGIYSVYSIIANYFVMFAMLGLNNYGNRSIALVSDSKKIRSKEFWGIYVNQIVCSLISSFGYFLYICWGAEDKKLASILLLSLVAALLDITWYISGIEKFTVVVSANVLLRIVNTVAIFIFVKSSEDLYIYAFILVAGNIISYLFSWLCVANTLERVKLEKKDIIKHIAPNMKFFIPVISISLYRYMGKFMLSILSTEIEVGYYASCERIVQIPVTVVNAIGIVMLPRITNMLANDSNGGISKQINKLTHTTIIFAMAMTFAMTFGIMAVSEEFVPLFYGPGFEKCIELFKYLLSSCWFMAFANVIRTQYIIPHKKDNVFIWSVLCGAMVNILVNLLLIPSMQSTGAAIGTVCAEGTVCIIQIVAVRKQLPIKKYVVSIIPFFMSAMLMYLIVDKVNIFEVSDVLLLVVKVLVGIFIYACESVILYFLFRQKKKSNK